MNKHTPGPWSYQPDTTFSLLGDQRIAAVNKISPAIVFGGLGEETKANACLIVASPDLLAACEEAFVALPMTKHHEPINEQLKAAIRKASGE